MPRSLLRGSLLLYQTVYIGSMKRYRGESVVKTKVMTKHGKEWAALTKSCQARDGQTYAFIMLESRILGG
jgi:hypothetical protein